MRVLLLVLALGLVCGSVAFAQAVTPADQVANAWLASALNVTNDQLNQLRAQGWSTSDIITAATISLRTNVPMSQIVASYQANPNWNAVMQNYNVTLNQLAMVPGQIMAQPAVSAAGPSVSNIDAAMDVNTMKYYNITSAQMSQFHSMGLSSYDIAMAADISRRANVPISQVLSQFCADRDWNTVMQKFNVPRCDIQAPSVGAGPTTSCGTSVCCTCPPAYMYDYSGNIILTTDEVNRYYKSGFDWLDVAIAANISRETGYPINTILQQMQTGMTWDQVIRMYGVSPDTAYNVCDYPFERKSRYSESRQAENMRCIQKYQVPRSGTGPCPSPCPTTTCPQVCPPATGAGPGACY